MRTLIHAAAALALIATSALTPAEVLGGEDPSLVARNPFPDQQAINNFQDYLHRLSEDSGDSIEVPSEFWTAARMMTYWGYEVIPSSVAGPPTIMYRQKYDIAPVLTSISDAIGSLGEDGCSFFHARDPHIESFSRLQITARARLEGEKRACTDVPSWLGGGTIKTDLGGIGGSAYAAVPFNVEPTRGGPADRYSGQFVMGTPSGSINAEVDSIFGINVHSVVGQIITFVAAEPLSTGAFTMGPRDIAVAVVLNSINAKAMRWDGNAVLGPEFADANGGVVQFSRYRSFMTKITSLTWSIQPSFVLDPDRTGFSGSVDQPSLELAFTTTPRPYEPVDVIVDDMRTEIELIKSFSQAGKHVTVQKGDTLWSVASREYGNPYFHYMLATSNGLNRRESMRIKVGQSLLLPPLYALTTQPHVHYMRPGETVSGVCKSLMPSGTATCLRSIRKLNPGLPLSYVRALEGVRVPARGAAA